MTAHVDTFARDNLPPREQWPQLRFDGAIEQLDAAVHPRRILQLRQLEQELRPRVARRQVVARERVDMRGRLHEAHAAGGDGRSSSRPITSRCTSVAPS